MGGKDDYDSDSDTSPYTWNVCIDSCVACSSIPPGGTDFEIVPTIQFLSGKHLTWSDAKVTTCSLLLPWQANRPVEEEAKRRIKWFQHPAGHHLSNSENTVGVLKNLKKKANFRKLVKNYSSKHQYGLERSSTVRTKTVVVLRCNDNGNKLALRKRELTPHCKPLLDEPETILFTIDIPMF